MPSATAAPGLAAAGPAAATARAGGAIVIRAQIRPLLLPIAHVRNQATSLTHVQYCDCSTSTQDIALTLLKVRIQWRILSLLSFKSPHLSILLLFLTSQGKAWPDRYL